MNEIKEKEYKNIEKNDEKKENGLDNKDNKNKNNNEEETRPVCGWLCRG